MYVWPIEMARSGLRVLDVQFRGVCLFVFFLVADVRSHLYNFFGGGFLFCWFLRVFVFVCVLSLGDNRLYGHKDG